jgi:arabinofuranosyltransferase
MKKFDYRLLFLILPLIAFVIIALRLDFIQDDAYITYRYVANYLNGDGLVFNIGERVEGFTNFGWVVYLLLLGALGIDFIFISKITGILFGAGFIVITYITAREIFHGKNNLFALLPPFLLGASAALSYWSQSGLETAFFVFFASLCFYTYVKKSWWLIFAIATAVWVRPEGALIAGLLIVTEMFVYRKLPRFTLLSSAIALVISLPFVVFKFLYYGSILPNPFYAKTGWTFEQLAAGLEYAGTFFKHYGFFGIGLFFALVYFRKLSIHARELVILSILYMSYVIVIGGDVLKVHRFFLTILGLFAIINTYALQLFFQKFTKKTQKMGLFVAAVILVTLTYLLPRDFVSDYSRREKGLTYAMQSVGNDIKNIGQPDMTIAASTIGIFSYELLGHTIIDMLGLTDSTIARHPQKPIEELETTWRERKYNAAYVLSRRPDFIVFSTGDKPSAPAEQALLLYPQFMGSYVAVDWYHVNKEYSSGRILLPAFKKVRPVIGSPTATYPPEYVGLYKRGREAYSQHKFDEAIALFDSAIAVSPSPPYKYLNVYKAMCYFYQEKHDITQRLFLNSLNQDSLIFDAHKFLYFYARIAKLPEAVEFHRSFINMVAPWALPYIEEDAEKLMATSK